VSLNDYKLLAVVAKEIEKMRQEQIAFVAASRADTFDEYKKVCGVIRGLNDLVQKMEKSDD
jgi:hypothetical protein